MTSGGAPFGWQEVLVDITTSRAQGSNVLVGSPRWPGKVPDWVKFAWTKLRSVLPGGQDWDVWIDWYEQRLRGGARGEAYELVFASVPQEEWEGAYRCERLDRGACAENAVALAARRPASRSAPQKLLRGGRT